MIRIALALFAVMALPAVAQQSSGDPLKDICTGFLAQGAGGVSGDHNKLCSCLVTETQSKLTRQEMVAYNDAATSGKPPPPAVMQKVMAIATQCLTAAAK